MKRQSFTLLPAAPIARKPSGFTMIELLVVIGIIIFLVTMTVSVVGSAITTAKEKNTKATIKMVDSLLTARITAFDLALKTQPQFKERNFRAVRALKNLYKKAFPQNLDEAFGVTDTVGDTTASSEALYEFLVNGETFGAEPVGAGTFKGDQVGDTDGDGRPEFLDGWGQPLRFYRWPTRLIRPADVPSDHQTFDTMTGKYTPDADGDFNPTGQTGYTAAIFFGSLPSPTTGELAKDPQDPLGIIHSALNSQNPPMTIEEFEHEFHSPETWSVPLIVSAGKDGVLGLFEPNDVERHGHLAQPDPTQLEGVLDNFTNRRLVP